MASAGGLVWILNKLLNRNHSWTKYTDPESGELVDFSKNTAFGDIVNKYTGHGLTTAEREANAFSAEEAQKSRDFTEYMTRNKYQMETASMEEAGINPAMMYGGGQLVPTAANGASASSVQPESGSLSSILSTIQSFISFPKQLEELQANIDERKSQAQLNADLGEAALRNAGAAERNAASQEKIASVREFEAQVAKSMADSNIEVNGATVKEIGERCQNLAKERSQMDAYLDIAEKNANSQQKQAIAALRSAEAAVQNAATNSYLSDYQTSLMYANELITYVEKEGKEIVNKYLSPRQQAELDKIIKEGVKLDKEGNLIDKQGHLVTAQTVKTYVNCGTDIANSVSRFVGISAIANKAGSVVSQSKPTPISPDMLYGNYGTFYE